VCDAAGKPSERVHLLRFTELLLEPQSFGDVAQDDDRVDLAAFLVRGGVDLERELLAVPSQAPGQVALGQGLSLAPMLREVEDARALGGRDQLEDRAPQQLPFVADAEHPDVRRVHHQMRARMRDADGVHGGAEQRAHPMLALAQGQLCRLAIGDVGEGSDAPDELSRPPDRDAREHDVPDGAASTEQLDLVRRGIPTHALVVLDAHGLEASCREELVEGRVTDVGRRIQLQHRRHGGVHEDRAPPGIDVPEADAAGLAEQTEALVRVFLIPLCAHAMTLARCASAGLLAHGQHESPRREALGAAMESAVMRRPASHPVGSVASSALGIGRGRAHEHAARALRCVSPRRAALTAWLRARPSPT